jgi:hypothetical protein
MVEPKHLKQGEAVIWNIEYVEAGYFAVEIQDRFDLGRMPCLLEELAQAAREKDCYRLLLGLNFRAGSESLMDLRLSMDLWNLRNTVPSVRAAILRPGEYGPSLKNNFDFLKGLIGRPDWEFALFTMKDPALEWLLRERMEG